MGMGMGMNGLPFPYPFPRGTLNYENSQTHQTPNTPIPTISIPPSKFPSFSFLFFSFQIKGNYSIFKYIFQIWYFPFHALLPFQTRLSLLQNYTATYKYPSPFFIPSSNFIIHLFFFFLSKIAIFYFQIRSLTRDG